MRLLWAIVLYGVFASPNFAQDTYRQNKVQTYFNILKDIPVDLVSDDSAIEEELARLDLYKQYSPKNYIIEKNLVFYNNRRTMGELDLVVREKNTGRVVLVAEVKRRNK